MTRWKKLFGKTVAPGITCRQYVCDRYVLSVTSIDGVVSQAVIKPKDTLESINAPSLLFVDCDKKPTALLVPPKSALHENEIDDFVQMIEQETELLESAKELILELSEHKESHK